MKKNILSKLFVVLLATTGTAFAQQNLLNAKSASEIGMKPVEDVFQSEIPPRPYQYVNDKDIVFEKKVWEIIPADQKANLQYFLPETPIGEFKSLFDVLMEGIQTGEITEVYDSYDFKYRYSFNEIQKKLSRTKLTDEAIEYQNLGLEVPEEYILNLKVKTSDVVAYKTMGLYYFDRMAGELKYRLLAICPIVTDVNTMDMDKASQQQVDLFWVFFPDARKVLYENYAYNPKNLRMKSSSDYLLNSRRFNATIIQTDNIYGDVAIREYVGDNAMLQLLEAERIKESVRELEDDLWSY